MGLGWGRQRVAAALQYVGAVVVTLQRAGLQGVVLEVWDCRVWNCVNCSEWCCRVGDCSEWSGVAACGITASAQVLQRVVLQRMVLQGVELQHGSTMRVHGGLCSVRFQRTQLQRVGLAFAEFIPVC